MELSIKRIHFNDVATIGQLFINGKVYCYTLEDTDRGLTQKMSLSQIEKLKIHSKTAIPYGKYDVGITFSNRFKKLMPQIFDVNGFAGIRIHSGNTSEDTEGCILVGRKLINDNFISESRIVYNKLFTLLQEFCKNEKVTITIQ